MGSNSSRVQGLPFHEEEWGWGRFSSKYLFPSPLPVHERQILNVLCMCIVHVYYLCIIYVYFKCGFDFVLCVQVNSKYPKLRVLFTHRDVIGRQPNDRRTDGPLDSYPYSQVLQGRGIITLQPVLHLCAALQQWRAPRRDEATTRRWRP